MKTGTSRLMDSHLVDFTNPNANSIKSGSTTSSQTEISDEEIEKAVLDSMDYVYLNPNDSLIFHQGWMRAIKWYREKLKQRQ